MQHTQRKQGIHHVAGLCHGNADSMLHTTPWSSPHPKGPRPVTPQPPPHRPASAHASRQSAPQPRARGLDGSAVHCPPRVYLQALDGRAALPHVLQHRALPTQHTSGFWQRRDTAWPSSCTHSSRAIAMPSPMHCSTHPLLTSTSHRLQPSCKQGRATDSRVHVCVALPWCIQQHRGIFSFRACSSRCRQCHMGHRSFCFRCLASPFTSHGAGSLGAGCNKPPRSARGAARLLLMSSRCSTAHRLPATRGCVVSCDTVACSIHSASRASIACWLTAHAAAAHQPSAPLPSPVLSPPALSSRRPAARWHSADQSCAWHSAQQYLTTRHLQHRYRLPRRVGLAMRFGQPRLLRVGASYNKRDRPWKCWSASACLFAKRGGSAEGSG